MEFSNRICQDKSNDFKHNSVVLSYLLVEWYAASTQFAHFSNDIFIPLIGVDLTTFFISGLLIE